MLDLFDASAKRQRNFEPTRVQMGLTLPVLAQQLLYLYTVDSLKRIMARVVADVLGNGCDEMRQELAKKILGCVHNLDVHAQIWKSKNFGSTVEQDVDCEARISSEDSLAKISLHVFFSFAA